MDTPPDIFEVFVHGAHAVAIAIADAEVGAAWEQPSVLEDQQVLGLAGHLARGGVWVVDEYLDAAPRDGPVDYEDAAEYYAGIREAAIAGGAGVRARAAAVGAVGQVELVRQLNQRLDALEHRLRDLGPDDLVAVIGGYVLRLGDYLVTRVAEQVVHLDDLARSIGHEGWPVTPRAREIVLDLGVAIARVQAGDNAVLRGLYRRGFADAVFPVL